jgi:hypothetical protein
MDVPIPSDPRFQTLNSIRIAHRYWPDEVGVNTMRTEPSPAAGRARTSAKGRCVTRANLGGRQWAALRRSARSGGGVNTNCRPCRLRSRNPPLTKGSRSFLAVSCVTLYSAACVRKL